jgi:hypothetical protein
VKTVIDNLTSASGWVVANSTVTATTWPMFASSHLSGQLQFNMDAAGTASKTFAAIATPYANIGFNIISKDADGDDYRLKYRIYTAADTYKEYYVPLSTQFVQVQLKNYYTSVIKIEFIAVEAVEFFVCEMINYTDNIPFDLYTGVLNRLASVMETMPQIGVLTCSAGATSVTITSPKYLDKYLTIKVGNEIHQIDSITQGKTVTFTAYGTGKAMAGAFTSAPVYLYLPTEIEPGQFFIFEPGYSFTEGFQSKPVLEQEHYSVLNDSFETSGINRVRRIGPYFEYTVRVQTMARHGKIAEILLRILKKAFASAEYVWINGQKHEAECPEGIQQQSNGDATDIENIYFCDVLIIASEEIWPEETQDTAELTVTKTVTVITE